MHMFFISYFGQHWVYSTILHSVSYQLLYLGYFQIAWDIMLYPQKYYISDYFYIINTSKIWDQRVYFKKHKYTLYFMIFLS